MQDISSVLSDRAIFSGFPTPSCHPRNRPEPFLFPYEKFQAFSIKFSLFLTSETEKNGTSMLGSVKIFGLPRFIYLRIGLAIYPHRDRQRLNLIYDCRVYSRTGGRSIRRNGALKTEPRKRNLSDACWFAS